MMTLALKLLKHRATWGVGVTVGFLLAISVHGHLRYRDGVAAGVTQQKAVDDSVKKIADAAEARARAESDSIIAALRVTLAQRDRDLQIAKQASALASGRYAQARDAYEALKAAKLASGDTTTTPLERACETTAATCALTVKAKEAEVVAVEAKLATAEQLAARQDSTIRGEPARVNRAVERGVAEFSATQPKRNRVGWFALGGVIGVALGALR